MLHPDEEKVRFLNNGGKRVREEVRIGHCRYRARNRVDRGGGVMIQEQNTGLSPRRRKG